MKNPLPKRLAIPANGATVDTEPDDLKGARLLGTFRHLAAKKGPQCFGLTIAGAKFMVIKFCPQPDGPHNPDSDFTGTEL